MQAAWQSLPQYLSGHLFLVVVSLLTGLALSLPLGILASRNRWFENIVMSFAGVVQTIPSLALLALMVPLLGGTIGRLPAFLALALYSILPIIRNVIIGLTRVDAGLMEAGRGMGMTELQLLRQVQFPLALPVIVAGLRTSTVLVVGTATLATPVGADSLGYYIFMGLNTRQTAVTVFGCVFAAILALALDRMIELIQRAVRDRVWWRAGRHSAVLAALICAGLVAPWLPFPDFSRQEITNAAESEKQEIGRSTRNFNIGGKAFSESYVLAEVLAAHTRKFTDGEVTVTSGLGSKIAFDALVQSTIDSYVDYSGTVWATVLKRNEALPAHQILLEVSRFLFDNYGIVVAGTLGFENAYGLAMRRDRAEELVIRSLRDLAKHAPTLKIAGDFDFFGRPEGAHVLQTYGLKFQNQVNMNSRLMYDALVGGDVDIVTAYTSDGQIAAFDLVVLEDPLEALPPYDAMILISPKAAAEAGYVRHMQQLVNQINDATMRSANKSVDLDKHTVSQAAMDLYAPLKKLH
jgi:osmoprotectant transport system permease protein